MLFRLELSDKVLIFIIQSQAQVPDGFDLVADIIIKTKKNLECWWVVCCRAAGGRWWWW